MQPINPERRSDGRGILAPVNPKRRRAVLRCAAWQSRRHQGRGLSGNTRRTGRLAYRFEDSRSGDCVRRHLRGYNGILQVDGYAAYNKLIRKDGAMTARAWRDAGPIVDAASMNFMRPAPRRSPPPRSSG